MSLIDDLRALRPLQKPHYSSNPDYNDADRDLLAEYARLARGLTVEGEWVTEDQVQWACSVVQKLRATDPLATLSVHWGHFGTEKYGEMQTRLAAIGHAAELAGVTVGAVVFDCEAQHGSAQDADAVHRMSHRRAVETLNPGRVIWYNRGGVTPAATVSGWHTSLHFDYAEPGDGFSVALYRVPEIETTREQFRRTVANAGLGREVTPFVALGAGYRRTTRSMGDFDKAWDYDPIYSWQLGAEINEPWFADRPERFAPWSRARRVCFYPAPFAFETWGRHFVAYVKGANMNREL